MGSSSSSRCFSFTTWSDKWFRYSFSKSGLKSTTTDLGDGTVMHCWNRFISQLTRHFNVYVPDLVFFGDSTTTRPERSEQFQAKCVMGLLEGHGVSRMSVVGLSYGGFVAYSMAAMFPEKVVKLVVCCAGVCMEDKDMDDGLFQVKSVDEAVSVLLPQTPEMIKELVKLTFFKPIRTLPNWFLNDFIEPVEFHQEILYLLSL